MSSNFIKTKIDAHVILKVLVFGRPEAGKSHLGFAMAKPGQRIGVFAAEKVEASFGKQFPNVDVINVAHSQGLVEDFITIVEAAKAGKDLELDWLVIDGWTRIEEEIRKGYPDPTTLSQGQRAGAYHTVNTAVNNVLQHLEGESACNIFMTAREKNEWATHETSGLTDLKGGTIGIKPDGYKTLEHPFSLSFNMRIDSVTGKRMAVVRKTRWRQVFAKGAIIPDLSTRNFAPIYEGSQIDEVTYADLQRLYAEAGSPNGTFVDWAKIEGILAEGKTGTTPTQRLVMRDRLEALIEERAASQRQGAA